MDQVKEEMIKQEERGEQPDALKAAEAIALRIERANEEARNILKEQEQQRMKDILAGRAKANIPQKEPELSPQEYARLALQNKLPKNAR